LFIVELVEKMGLVVRLKEIGLSSARFSLEDNIVESAG